MPSIINSTGYGVQTLRLSTPNTPDPVNWDPGVYMLMEYAQTKQPSSGVSGASGSVWMPPTYNTANPSNHSGSIYQILQEDTWCKGMVFPLFLGDIATNATDATTWTWTDVDDAFEKIAAINTALAGTGLKKKIMLKLNFKVTEVANLTRLLPDFAPFNTTQGAYPGVTSTPATGATAVPISPYCWGYLQGAYGKGYHYYLKNFRTGLTGNDLASQPIYTLRNLMYKLIDEVVRRYATHPTYKDIFAGIIDSESASMNAIDGSISPNDTTPSTTERNKHFEGRLELLKYCKTKFTKHLVASDANFDQSWVTAMSGNNTTSHMAVNKIACTVSDWHIGRSLTAIYNYHDHFRGLLPILAQLQPDQMESKTHKDIPYWGWSEANPTAKGANNATGGNVSPVQDEPDGDHIFLRNTQYFEANYFIIQFNKATTNTTLGGTHIRYNSDRMITWYRASAYVNDPEGGMNATQPAYVV